MAKKFTPTQKNTFARNGDRTIEWSVEETDEDANGVRTFVNDTPVKDRAEAMSKAVDMANP